jgi:hypothetical protein
MVVRLVDQVGETWASETTQRHYRTRARRVAAESIAILRSTPGRPGGTGSRQGPPAMGPHPRALETV